MWIGNKGQDNRSLIGNYFYSETLNLTRILRGILWYKVEKRKTKQTFFSKVKLFLIFNAKISLWDLIVVDGGFQ